MANNAWQSLLTHYANRVGFVKSRKLASYPVHQNCKTRPAMLWKSPYAQLLALPGLQPNEQELRNAANCGQEWLDVSCMVEERLKFKVVDAYLLLVFSEVLPRKLFS